VTEVVLIHKGYKFRIYPNVSQQKELEKHFGHARFVYNYFLEARKIFFETHKTDQKKNLTYHDTAILLTDLKKDQAHLWLKEVNSQVLQQSLMDLQKAYVNFFERRSGFPKFKKKSGKQSFRVPQHFKIDLTSQKITLPKIGKIKTVFHREPMGQPKSITITKTCGGKYFASVLCQVHEIIKDPQGEEVGVDLGLSCFATLSNGRKYENPRYLRGSERKIKRLQHKLSRQVNGSKSREKTRLRIARVHEKVSNQRTDFLNKISFNLTHEFGLIGMEDMNIRGMLKNHKLAKSISDVGWSELVRQIKYKSLWYGSWFEQIGTFEPSTIECNNCHSINRAFTLKDREWVCPICGMHHDRDINAAIVILNKTRAGRARSHAGGDDRRPTALGPMAIVCETGSSAL